MILRIKLLLDMPYEEVDVLPLTTAHYVIKRLLDQLDIEPDPSHNHNFVLHGEHGPHIEDEDIVEEFTAGGIFRTFHIDDVKD